MLIKYLFDKRLQRINFSSVLLEAILKLGKLNETNINVGLAYKKMRVESVHIITNFTRFQSLKLRIALVSVSMLFVVTLHAMSEYNVLPDWNLLATFDSADVMEGDEFQLTPEYLEEVRLSNETNLLCNFGNFRSDFCEIRNFIQIFGRSSRLTYDSSLTNRSMQAYRGLKIKPHPRKHDKIALARVKGISMEPISLNQTPPHCSVIIAPAIVFSTGGYIGNMFHDFTDVLIPLLITSFPFQEMQPWWIKKYRVLLEQLTRYKIIHLNRVKRALCYSHVIIGLKFHKEMSIDPKKTDNKYSMVDFGRTIRKSFGLERENATPVGFHDSGMKPRLLIISRKKSRSFSNIKEIIKMATELGYEVVVQEPNKWSELRDFAHIVNSCDVLMGVHGAGLTNFVFLPTNAVVIQIVPLGGLEKLAMVDFGIPALDMKYGFDDVVLKDPSAIRRRGWGALRSTYLINQNVRLDVTRFRGTLLEALKLLYEA